MADQNTRRRDDMQLNVGLGGATASAAPTERQPSLAQRVARGDYRIQRAPLGDPSAQVNVGMGGGGGGPKPRLAPGLIPTAAASTPPAQAAGATAPRAPTPRVNVGPVQTVATGPRLQPGDANTFTGSNGVTRAVQAAPAAAQGAPAPAPALSARIAAPPSQQPAVRDATTSAVTGQRDLTRTTRADAAEFLNPMSNSAEILRRFQNSQNSYFNKGSPQARRMAGEAILGQLGAQNQASAAGQQAGNATLQQGVGFEAGANEGAARRQIDADMFNADDSYRNRALEADIQRPTLQADAQGNLLSIAGTAARPVTGEDGTQVRLARPETVDPRLQVAQLESIDMLASQVLGLDQFGKMQDGKKMRAPTADELAQARVWARQQIQGGAPAQQIPVGTERGGYRYRGGDPASQASWERIN